MKKLLKSVGWFIAGMLLMTACKEKTPAPTGTITANVVSNIVTFEVEATDATVYEWDFGDGTPVSTIKNPTHTYLEYGQTYTVTLTLTGPGGDTIIEKEVTIAAMSKMDMLTGGPAAANGKKWRMNATAPAFRAVPNATLTIDKNYPAGVLSALGYTTVYQDEFTFKNDGSFTINPKGTGVCAGLAYCIANSIPNVPPSVDAQGAGLTLITPYTAPTGLTFTFNESKSLTITVTADGTTSADVTYNGVMTLSFSTNGFLGVKDFVTECLVQEITATSLKIAYFVSACPPNLPMVGKTTNVLIFSFEVVP